ncbi:MAG: DUF4352 domain-containing protein [Phycisphaerae bacterium]
MNKVAVALCVISMLSASLVAARPVPEDAQTVDLARMLKSGKGGGIAMYLSLEGAVFQGEKPEKGKDKDMTLVLNWREKGWIETVSVAIPNYNQAGHTGHVSGKPSDLGKVIIDAKIGSDKWVKGDENAQFSLKLKETDGQVSGSFEGTFKGQKVSGKITGKAVRAGWRNAEVKDGKVHVELDMGTKRVNWNNARWAVWDFMNVLDLTDYSGIVVTVETDSPRTDAWVDMALMEDDGSHYWVRDAIPLTQKKQTVFVSFDDLRAAEWIFNTNSTGTGAEGNFDENFHFDRNQAARICFGTVNPLGIGTVKFRVSDVKLVKAQSKPETVKATVTGKTYSVNGQDEVPGGIFGFHHVYGDVSTVKDLRVGSMRSCQANGWGSGFAKGPKPEYNIDMWITGLYDRKQVLPQVDHADWQKGAKAAGQGIGNSAKSLGSNAYVEWWNEPYLELQRMAERKLTSKLKAPEGVKEGDPVVLHGKKLESMVWTRDGDKWVVKDPTRFTYWSARQNAIWYTETFVAMAKEAKKIAPEVNLIGGFGFRWNEDEWASWELCDKYLIDNAIEYLDGYCEHHYQGHTDGVAASYDVLQAYTDWKYDKRLPIYNTETNDLWDAPARGRAAAAGQFHGKFRSRRRMIYNLADILYLIKTQPDKAVARAIHAHWKSAGDNRIKLGDTSDNKQFKVKATGMKFAQKVGETISGDDAVFVVIDVEVTNKNRRNRNFSPGLLKIKKGDDVQTIQKAEKIKDVSISTRKIDPRKTATGKVVYKIPAEMKDAVITWIPMNKARQVYHLSGDFLPWKVAPWERIGIDEGEYWCLKFLSDLRGKLVAVENPEENIWVVSSIDDETHSLVTVVYNNDWRERKVELTVNAPEGTSFDGGTTENLEHRSSGKIELHAKPFSVADKSVAVILDLKPAHAAKYSIKLKGKLPTSADIARRQIFAEGILKKLQPGKSAELPIELPADAAKAEKAWVRLIVERCGQGEGTVTVGGKTLTIPAAYTPSNTPYIREIEIDPATLKGVKSITAAAAGPETGNGFLLCSGSIVIEK